MESNIVNSARILKVLLIISILVNMMLTSITITNLQEQNSDLKYSTLVSQNQNLSRTINSANQELTILQNQLSYYKSQAEYYSRLSRLNKTSSGSLIGSSEVNIVAVRIANTSFIESTYEGVVMTAHIELRAGQGRLLINTRPKIGIDLQTSANTAIIVAENLTGLSLQDTDVILTVTADSETEILDGPSAGTAITVALIAAIRNQTLNPSVFMTGTVNPDGTVGKIGGVLEKAIAAARFGAIKFLVPLGQSIALTYRTEESHPAPGLTIITTKPESIVVQEYLNKQGLSLEVLEIGSVAQAYDLFIQTK